MFLRDNIHHDILECLASWCTGKCIKDRNCCAAEFEELLEGEGSLI